MASGMSKPTTHKAIISTADLDKIHEYFKGAPSDPIILRQCVWFQVAIHFVTRELEFQSLLSMTSFDFMRRLMKNMSHLHMKQSKKNFQGGLKSEEALADKRMYATGEANCHVQMLHLLICCICLSVRLLQRQSF